jgi:glycosyltransferase involved in cell wall biosynthesis
LTKPRVIYRSNIPSPYFVDRFNEIARRGNLDFEAWFDAERLPDRSWDVKPDDWSFHGRYIVPSRFGPARQIRAARPDVFYSLYGSLSFTAAVLAARASGSKMVLRVLKTFDSWRERGRAREIAKHLIFRAAHAVHTTGPDGEAYARQYGARQIIAFPEPIDVDRFRTGSETARLKAGARQELGLEGCVFLYVGRIWRGKGLDYLFEAFRRLRDEGVQCSLLVVGDGVDQDHYRAAAGPRITFVDFVQQPELPYYYGLADAFVFPTLGDPYGHVVHEAMAASLPVVSTDSAGDIRQRVMDGETGFVVPAANSDALLEKMRTLAAAPALRGNMGAAGFELVRPRTVEWWVSEFEQMIFHLLESRNESGTVVGLSEGNRP